MKHYRALCDHWKANVNFSSESKTIQNQLITCIHNELWDFVRDEIHSATSLSIEADEMTDVAHHSQLPIISRYVAGDICTY